MFAGGASPPRPTQHVLQSPAWSITRCVAFTRVFWWRKRNRRRPQPSVSSPTATSVKGCGDSAGAVRRRAWARRCRQYQESTERRLEKYSEILALNDATHVYREAQGDFRKRLARRLNENSALRDWIRMGALP